MRERLPGEFEPWADLPEPCPACDGLPPLCFICATADIPTGQQWLEHMHTRCDARRGIFCPLCAPADLEAAA